MQYATITEGPNDPLRTDAQDNLDHLVDKLMTERRITKSAAWKIVSESPEGQALYLANKEQRRANYDKVAKAKPVERVLVGAAKRFDDLVKETMAGFGLAEPQATVQVMKTAAGVAAYEAVRAQKRGL